MLLWVLLLLMYGFMNYYIYKRISLGFRLSSGQKTLLKFVIIAASGLYPTAHFVQFIFSINTYPLLHAGVIWILGTLALCTLCFLETGLTLVFPSKTRWWLTGALVLFVLYIYFLSTMLDFGERIPGYLDVAKATRMFGFLFLIVFTFYKIIVGTLKLTDKKKGGLIILFSTGFFFNLMGMAIGLLSMMFGIYAVVFARVSTGLNLSKKKKRFIMALFFVGFAISVPQMTWWGNGLGIPLLYFAGGTWYGLIAMAITLFILESGVSLFLSSYRRLRVIIVLILLALAVSYGVFNGTMVLKVKELKIPMKKLPENLSGLTIVQWSDFHLGDILTEAWLQKTVEKTNALEPDLVVITGDLTDHGFKNKERYIALLKHLKARFGIMAVTGNHEYYWNRFPIFNEISKKVGIRVLRNEAVTLSNGIQIAGINDPTARRFGENRPDLGAALKNVDFQKPVILLSHKPGYFEVAKERGVDLQLSGHTHAGQIPPMDIISKLVYPYFYGLYQEGDSYIHVSCGTGLWGIPMRIFSQNEITKITLVSH